MQHSSSTNLSDFSFTIVSELLLTGFAPKRLSLTGFNKRIFIQICSGLLWMKAITLLSQTLTGLPLDEWCLCFYSSAKESSVALKAPVGLFFSDVMVRKKIFVCRTPGHIRIHYQQQNNSVIMWTHFSPITPDKIIYHRLVGNGLFVYT